MRAQAQRLPPEQIIFVPKVDSTRFKERRCPTRAEIDAAAPGRAAMADNGCASVLSSVLLQRLRVTRDKPQPAYGRIIKDKAGNLTGLILRRRATAGKFRANHPTGGGATDLLLDAYKATDKERPIRGPRFLQSPPVVASALGIP